MIRYIKANNSFSTMTDKEEICNAVRRIFGQYIKKEDYYEGTKQYAFELDGGYFLKELSILVGVRDTSNNLPRTTHPSSSADNYPCYLQVLNTPYNCDMLSAFGAAGFKEVCDYEHPQWGTYKILLNSIIELEECFNIFQSYRNSN